MTEERPSAFLVFMRAAAVVITLVQLYALANVLSDGELDRRLREVLGPQWRKIWLAFKRAWDLEARMTKETGHVIWEAMVIIEEEAENG